MSDWTDLLLLLWVCPIPPGVKKKKLHLLLSMNGVKLGWYVFAVTI